MRAQLLVASIFASGLILLGVACGTETIYVQEDAGNTSSASSSSSGKTSTSSSSGVVGDDDDDDDDDGGGSTTSSTGGPVTFDLKSEKVVDRDDVVIVGLVGNDIVYQVAKPGAPRDWFAVPIEGGTPVKLWTFVAGEGLAVSGGAVAHWTAVANGVGTLEVWTRGTGLKQNIATGSVISAQFRATADGSRIAFTQNATIEANKPVAAEMGIRDTAGAANLVTFTGVNNTVNLASTADCAPRFTFATGSKAFFASFCAGKLANETRARILAVPEASPAIIRIDGLDEGSANTMLGRANISVDAAGTKVAGVTFATGAATVFNVATPVTKVEIETGANDVTLFPNGSAAIYRVITPNPDAGATPIITLKKGTTASPSVKTTVGTGVGILGPASPDGTRLVYGTIRDAATGQFDLHMLDLTAATPAAPKDLVAGAKGTIIGYTATGTHLVFTDATTAAAPKVKAVALATGTVTDVAPGVGGKLAGTGNGMVVFSKPDKQGTTTFFEGGFVDAVAGGAVKSISDAIPNSELYIKDKKVAYIRAKQGDYAIYGLTLP